MSGKLVRQQSHGRKSFGESIKKLPDIGGAAASSSGATNDSSKSLMGLVAERTDQPKIVMQSMRAPNPDMDAGDVDDVLDQIEEVDDYKAQALKFPPSRATGAPLILERLDFMAKQIERMRMAPHTPHTPSSPKGKRPGPFGDDEDAKGAHGIPSDDEDGEDDGRSGMEEIFVQASLRSSHDVRLLELLGTDKQNALFEDQQRIVEYFKTKHLLMEKAKQFANMQDICAADDDALHELSVWHGKVDGVVEPKKQTKIDGALGRETTDVLNVETEFARQTTDESQGSPTTPSELALPEDAEKEKMKRRKSVKLKQDEDNSPSRRKSQAPRKSFMDRKGLGRLLRQKTGDLSAENRRASVGEGEPDDEPPSPKSRHPKSRFSVGEKDDPPSPKLRPSIPDVDSGEIVVTKRISVPGSASPKSGAAKKAAGKKKGQATPLAPVQRRKTKERESVH